MSKINKKTIEDSISYHESNLASLIAQRNKARVRAANGEFVAKSFFDKIERTIADIKNIIHNWRTKGRGYD